mgnify:CR=1 FL=1
MSFDVICFDCDSTLSRIEGIDELARRAGMGEEMSRLTDLAMNGIVPLEAVYERRLALIRPDQDSINWLADLYIAEIVEGVKEVFAALFAQLDPSVPPDLRLPENHVHAVDIYFNEDGSYRHYDLNSPLARTGGKAVVVSTLKGQCSLVMVGDGKTDLEAKQAGAYVLGFGGVADRAIVRELADFYTAEPSLLSVLEHIL